MCSSRARYSTVGANTVIAMPEPHSEARRTRIYQDIHDAVEQVSLGLVILQGQIDVLENLGPTTLVDISARLQAQRDNLEKLLQPLRSRLVVLSGEYGTPLVRGSAYQAEVRKETQTVLDVEKVQDFLGRELLKFQDNKETTVVVFQIKG